MDNFDEIRHSELYQSYKSGANWFYWIAGLTLITSIITVGGGDWRFLISLGTTQMIDAIAHVLSEQLGGATKVIGLVLDIFITALFVFFGVLAGKKMLWVYLLGMIAFGLDGLVSLLIGDWIGVLAHAVVLFFMIRGYMAGRDLIALEREIAQQPPPVESPAAAPSV
jgi:surface polysaccharide O-acyltransferase-like enzyme